jgi:hypothetical protein
MKRKVLQTGGKKKKMKLHKGIPKLTLMEDDAELVAKKGQDHVVEARYNGDKKIEEIIKNFIEVKDTFKQLQLTIAQ